MHPIFLLLINITTSEGYWLFAQKFLTEKTPAAILAEQQTLRIHFEPNDNLFNLAKFKCLLPAAEQFVRDLHPGSPVAAIQKRRAELEAIDPRCSVSISVRDGAEHVTIIPKEIFTFTTKVSGEAEADWQRLFERGEKIKVKRNQISFSDAPLLQETLKNIGEEFEIQYGTEAAGSIQIIGKDNPVRVVSMDGKFRSGIKYFSFQGGFGKAGRIHLPA